MKTYSSLSEIQRKGTQKKKKEIKESTSTC